MSYKLKVSENDTLGKAKYTNEAGMTGCVEFVRQATGAPATTQWTQGLRIADAPGQILRGTAIATFDDQGRYPTDGKGKHAAIYLFHIQKDHIQVLDQWDDQGEVKERPIWFNRPKGTKRSNDANAFYVIE